MSQPESHILLVCHSFPPYPNIGGRRWAKFAKYLVRRGFHVHVITAPNPYPHESSWTNDVRHPNIHVYPVPDGYPDLTPAKTWIGKLQNQFQLLRLRLLTRGTIYDRGIFWEKALMAQVYALIRSYGIGHIIVTGAPFYPFHYMLAVRKQYPAIRLIYDYRDPWTSAVNYGIPDLSPARFRYEQQIEREALRGADIVVSPTDPHILIPEAIQQAQTSARVLELSHAYDPDDLPDLAMLRRTDDTIRLIYGGTLYIGCDPLLQALAEALTGIRELDPALYQRLRLDFYTPETHFASFFQAHEEVVRFHKPIPAQDIYMRTAEADICLLFLAWHNKHFKTTKFYEFLTLRKPFLLLGEQGRVAEFIAQERLGVSIPPADITADTLRATILDQAARKDYHEDFDYTQYSFERITDQLIGLIT